MTDYATLEEFKRYLRIPTDSEGGDDIDDAELAVAITAASRTIDRFANRTFTPVGEEDVVTARIYTARYNRDRLQYEVVVDDFMDDTGLVVKYDPIGDGTYSETVTDTHLYPTRAATYGQPWTRIQFTNGASVPLNDNRIEVTALWGWTAVPASIKEATLIQASRYWKRRDAPFGVVGGPDQMNWARLMARIDPDVELLVTDWRRWWSAA